MLNAPREQVENPDMFQQHLAQNKSTSYIPTVSFNPPKVNHISVVNDKSSELARLDMTLAHDIQCKIEYIKERATYYNSCVIDAPNILYRESYTVMNNAINYAVSKA